LREFFSIKRFCLIAKRAKWCQEYQAMTLKHLYAVPSAEQKAAQVTAANALMDRLDETLRAENAILESQTAVDHAPYIGKKNHILREMMILQRTLIDPGILKDLATRMVEVRALVDRNYTLLNSQVTAMRDVTSILTTVALAEDADGTYSRQQQ
jgi:hypothetical protein